MKIFYLTSMFPNKYNKYSGIFVYHRVFNLLKKGYKVNVFAYNQILKFKKKFPYIYIQFRQSYYIKKIKVNVINFLYLPKLINGFGVLSFIIKKIFNKDNYNVLHIHKVYPDGFIGYYLNKKYNIPYIVSAHGSEISYLPYKNIKYKNNIIKTLNNSVQVIFNSYYLLKEARKLGYNKKNYSVIPNGIDLNLFKIYNKESIYKEFKLNSSYIYIGFIGSFHYVKGADLLPDIFKKIKILDKNNKIRFIIIGDGVLNNKVSNKIRQYRLKKYCIFYKNMVQEDIVKLLNIFNILLLPSRREAFGCICIEALACGTPVITSSNAGFTDFVKKMDNNLSIVSYNEKKERRFVDEFAKKSVELLKINFNRNRIRKTVMHLTWDSVVNQEIALYKKFYC